jgi:hypothetical protein
LQIHDVNNVQALMLFNMGDAEISVGELTQRGYYLGLERLVQREEIIRERLPPVRALGP